MFPIPVASPFKEVPVIENITKGVNLNTYFATCKKSLNV
jgi:hypothetical protein